MSGMDLEALMNSPMFSLLGEQGEAMKKAVQKDPELLKQVGGYWKMLDDMADSNPDEYRKVTSEATEKFHEEISEERDKKRAKQTIESERGFCMKILPSKILEQKNKKDDIESGVGHKVAGGIKLFDNQVESQINESFMDNEDSNDPLEEPKIYLNIVFHDKVIPPLNKENKLADEKNDRTWRIIPICFSIPEERKSMSGKRCIHFDGHVNTCVFKKMKGDQRSMKALINYFVQKFQHMLREEFVLHKKSIKFLKEKKYKDHKGQSTKVKSFVLPSAYDKEVYMERFKAAEEEAKKTEVKKEDIKLTDISSNKDKEQESISNIKLPGQHLLEEIEGKKSKPESSSSTSQSTTKTEKPKKVLIQEVKQKPQVTQEHKEDKQVVLVISVPEESSAKDIDLDLSSFQLKLESKNYELLHKFDGFKVDSEQIKAKFSKSKKTLTLTLTKL